MTISVERGRGGEKTGMSKFTKDDLLKVRAELSKKIGGPYLLREDPKTGEWCLLITEPRAKELGLEGRVFNLQNPRDALKELEKAWPKKS